VHTVRSQNRGMQLGKIMGFACTTLCMLVTACAQPEQSPRTPRQESARTSAAIAALRESRFADALRESDSALGADPRDARAAAVRAIARYQRAIETLVKELLAVLDRGVELKFLDHEQGRKIWLAFSGELEAVDRDLATVSADPAFSLELCVACLSYDWNGNGRLDARDRRMLELEYDATGKHLDEGDARRRPTYRFDVGDAYWGRAMISFQRAAVELVLAYRWSELDKLMGDSSPAVTIKLVDRGRVTKARELLLAGLGFSAQERDAYLAETDDDREWVPSPRQNNYAMPLAVDDQLYATWAALLGDAHRLLASHEGVRFREVAELFGDPGDADKLPDAYLDLGRMFRDPTDIVIDFRKEDASGEMLRGLLGNGFAKQMRASPLVARLRHMREQLERGEDTLDRKLRYLIWLN
jgi:hypothetical protein